jgi:hypothetical protein
MPVVSSIVAEEGATDSNNEKWLRFEFTLSDGRVDGHYGYRRYPAATVADTQRLALVAPLNAILKERERNEAWRYGMDGNDIDVFPWIENTTAEIQQYWWRRFMNFMRDDSTDPDINSRNELVATALVPLGYVNKPSSPQIVGYLDAGWSIAQVNGAISKASALYLGVINLDHGEPEIV